MCEIAPSFVHGRVPPKATATGTVVRGGRVGPLLHPSSEAATLWYHDHTRHQQVERLRGAHGRVLIRDEAEDALNLPRDRYDIPLLICDRLLRSDGQLDYPTSGVRIALGRRRDR